jgi:hypothetical protein
MAVIQITDSKNLPPIIQVTIGRKATNYKVKTTSIIYNKSVI